MKFHVSTIQYDIFRCVLENSRNCFVKSKRIFLMVEKIRYNYLLKIKNIYYFNLIIFYYQLELKKICLKNKKIMHNKL